MRIFAHQTNQLQKPASRPVDREHPNFNLQRTIGDQPAPGMLDAHAEGPNVEVSAAPGFGHNFRAFPYLRRLQAE